jgi:signal transduction histidine kinase
MARVLIVEGNTHVAFDLKTVLRTAGHEVVGIRKCCDAAARAPLVNADLIVVDVPLHEAQAWVDALSDAQGGAPVPVLLLTPKAEEARVEAIAKERSFAYLVKACSVQELLAAVDAALFAGALGGQGRANEEWVAKTLQSVDLAVVATGLDGRVRLLNRAAAALTGCSLAEALARPIEEVVALLDEKTGATVPMLSSEAMAVNAALAPMRPCLLRRRDSTQVVVDQCGVPIHDTNGCVIGSILLLRDLADERRLASRLAMQERLAGLGTLSASIAHEINNPLTYVVSNLGFIDETIARMTGAEPSVLEELRQCLREALLGAARIRTIVADMRLFAQSSPSFSTFDLREAIDDAARFTGPEVARRATFSRLSVERPVSVQGDKRQLAQLFGVLLVNAAQAIPDEGPNERRVTLLLEDAGGEAVIRVSDTGVGMAPEVLMRIFDPYFTTKAMGVGTGLGLSIAHGIAEAHGAQLRVETRVGEGTTVEVRLATV